MNEKNEEEYYYSEGYVYKGLDTICKIYGTNEQKLNIGIKIVKSLNNKQINK